MPGRCNPASCKPEKTAIPPKTENPESFINQAFRESKWRDSASRRNLNLRTAPLERSHCSFRLIRSPLFRLRRTAHCADVRLAYPRPYRPLVFEIPPRRQQTGVPVKGTPVSDHQQSANFREEDRHFVIGIKREKKKRMDIRPSPAS